MSVALIDIGNSRIKWGIAGDEGVSAIRAVTRAAAVESEYVPLLNSFPAEVSRIVAANVAGSTLAEGLGAAAHDRFNIDIEFLRSRAQFGGLSNAYAKPGTLGVDRWAAMLGVIAAGAGAALVVDAGTACTIDRIDENGVHRGGMILPGAGMMENALLSRTADIRFRREQLEDPTTPGEFFASNTPLAVQNGCLQAIVGAITRSYDTLQKSTRSASFWITGGDAPSLLPHLPAEVEHRPALVLEGLRYFAMTESDR